ncbi:MAG: hypothetical protein F6K47_15450 [Symploca sp. SIO2E6]|nr:hypothetical protein [Symploca sp. SIO2E6]
MSSGQNAEGLSDLFTDFVQQVTQKADNPRRVMQEVRRWTADQLFLSDLLCKLILVHQDFVPNGQEEFLVEQIVQENIIKDWETNHNVSAHFQKVIQTILEDNQRDAVLNLYWQILQRGQVSVNSSQEQEKLVQSGLVKRENGKLKVGNAIYESIFNSEWVEQQSPNIAQPTSTTSYTMKNNQTTFFNVLSIVALVLIVVAPIARMFFLQPEKNPVGDPNRTPTSESTSSLSDTDIESLHKKWLDKGKSHAKNGDWLEMWNEFCRIPQEGSIYFDDAESKLDQWIELYEKDIQVSLNTFWEQGNKSCPVAETILDSSPIKK